MFLVTIKNGNQKDGPDSRELRQVQVPVVNGSTCRREYQGDVQPTIMMCAGGVGGRDSCDVSKYALFRLNTDLIHT